MERPNYSRRVLVACERSGVVRDALRAVGVDAWSCDLVDSDAGGPHLKMCALEALRFGWHDIIAFPPCTYIALSGWHRIYREPGRAQRAVEALDFFHALLTAPCERVAVENPRSAAGWLWPSAQVLRPCWFGDEGTKETHLWLRGFPPLLATLYHPAPRDLVAPVPPGPDRQRLRSLTPPGLAAAMVAQWYGNRGV